jgi:LacI family transcriptional regulator
MQRTQARIDSPRAITMKDIAQRCGVSKITVSRALREDAQNVSERTRRRILAVAEEMGYDPSRQHAARRLALTKNGQQFINQVIALFFPPRFQQISYFSAMFQGILDCTMAQGYGVLTYQLERNAHPNEPKLINLPPIFARGDIDGVIAFLPLGGFRDTLGLLREMPSFGSRPVISLIEPLPGCSTVLTDDFSGGYAACSHLLAMGHCDLLHSCYPTYPYQQRLAGFRQAFFDHGLTPDGHLIACEWNLYNDGVAREAFLACLRANPQVTGILAPNDTTAVKMADAVQSIGLRIPDDLSLVGNDDTHPLLDAAQTNILTTVRLPLVEVGIEAAQLMIRRITGEVDKDISLVLPVTLIERGSVAPPRQRT